MAGILEYKCPCCGGAIEFDSRKQKMKCPYCDTEFELDTLKEFEEEQLQEEGTPAWDQAEMHREEMFGEADGLVTYICESCGGEIVADSTMASSRCPYCDNPVIVIKQLGGGLKPDLVIPFKMDKETAKQNLKNHLKGKLLLPNAFKEESRIEEIKGIYVPFWLFDCEASADIRCRATKVRHWHTGDYEYTETSHFLVSRAGDLVFDLVPADGSSKMADDLMESIEPYRYEDAVDFHTAYLAGYLADKYDVSSEACYGRVNQRIQESTQRVLMNTIHGYTTCVPEKKDIRLKRGDIKYALLPVWVLHTRYKGELYTFAMNGQTGKFVGNLPMDMGKALGISGGVFAAVTVLVFLIMTLCV